MAKYNYSIERKNARGQKEVLQVVNCDSFEEAVTKVKKGVHARDLVESENKNPELAGQLPAKVVLPNVPIDQNSTAANANNPDK